jgi:hypothetical protein
MMREASSECDDIEESKEETLARITKLLLHVYMN